MARQKTYFISDTHFGHKNIIRWRDQFKTVEEHDQYIYENILNTVGHRDTLWILGDEAFTWEGVMLIGEIHKKVNKLHIVGGNHTCERKGIHARDILQVCDGFYGMRGKDNFWLMHAPVHPAELRGKYCIHGHVHHNTIDDWRYLNVSCEAIGYKPIEYSEVKEMFENAEEMYGERSRETGDYRFLGRVD